MRRRPHSSAAILESAAALEADARALAHTPLGGDAPAWTWDPVYSAATITLDRGALTACAAALKERLPVEVDKKRLQAANARLKDLAMWAGGVERGQRLFAPRALEDDAAPIAAHLFATLWPWTEDDGCTVRVGLWHIDSTLADRAALGALVRAWFNADAPI